MYGLARGQLPVFNYLINRGLSGVLHSEPAFTAVAMRKLVHPSTPKIFTVTSLIHEIGDELAGLSSIGANPFSAASLLMPKTPHFFEYMAKAGVSSSNLLFTHGGVQAGRHAKVYLKNGKIRDQGFSIAQRPLSKEELLLVDPKNIMGKHRHLAQSMAALFDGTLSIIGDKSIDLSLIRIEDLDLLTHRYFDDEILNGQDDGERLLFRNYRYIDRRLGEVVEAMDEDDTLIVMSDHGIHTFMKHDPRALFIMTTPGLLSLKHVEGTPLLDGVPRLLARLFNVEQDWPSSNLEDYLPKINNAQTD